MRKLTLILGLTIGLFGWVAAAQAHSFNVLLVGENVAQNGTYEGFRLATRERDAHANEESDGHLGGLDVYIFMAEPEGEMPDDINIVVMLEPGEAPDIGAQKVITAAEIRPQLRWAALIALDFEARYEEAYGQPPSEAASAGYYAAQLIERYVRADPDFRFR